MSKGMKSSEFWLAVGTVVSVLLADFANVKIDPATLATLSAAVGTYIVSRGMAKTEPRR